MYIIKIFAVLSVVILGGDTLRCYECQAGSENCNKDTTQIAQCNKEELCFFAAIEVKTGSIAHQTFIGQRCLPDVTGAECEIFTETIKSIMQLSNSGQGQTHIEVETKKCFTCQDDLCNKAEYVENKSSFNKQSGLFISIFVALLIYLQS